MRKKAKKKIFGVEKLLYIFTVLMVAAFPLALLFSQSQLSKVNYEVEKFKDKISDQSKKNESLQMKVDELASLEKLENIAKTMGLSYNNNNIKTIE